MNIRVSDASEDCKREPMTLFIFERERERDHLLSLELIAETKRDDPVTCVLRV